MKIVLHAPLNSNRCTKGQQYSLSNVVSSISEEVASVMLGSVAPKMANAKVCIRINQIL